MFTRHLLKLAAALLPAASVLSGATLYTITDIGSLPGSQYTAANGVNNLGQVIATSFTGPLGQAFIAGQQPVTQIDMLPGGTSVQGLDISDSGLVTGIAKGTGNSEGHAFLWNGTTTADLGVLPGAVSSVGSGINTGGTVVGYSRFVDGYRATIWDGSGIQDFGALLGPLDSMGLAINDASQVTGWYGNTAFLWDGQMHSLGTVTGGTYSSGRAINALGQVAGFAGLGNTSHAFFWDGVTMHDLGALGAGGSSDAIGINDLGQVVGSSSSSSGGSPAAFIWDGASMIDLNSVVTNASGWTLISAVDINNLGQIVGTGLYQGQYRSFLLTPEVPEPSTWVLALGGIGIMGVLRRRRP